MSFICFCWGDLSLLLSSPCPFNQRNPPLTPLLVLHDYRWCISRFVCRHAHWHDRLGPSLNRNCIVPIITFKAGNNLQLINTSTKKFINEHCRSSLDRRWIEVALSTCRCRNDVCQVALSLKNIGAIVCLPLLVSKLLMRQRAMQCNGASVFMFIYTVCLAFEHFMLQYKNFIFGKLAHGQLAIHTSVLLTSHWCKSLVEVPNVCVGCWLS